jgi:hypothetical protein
MRTARSGTFPVEKAAPGSRNLSVLHMDGEWHWLVILVLDAGQDPDGGSTPPSMARGVLYFPAERPFLSVHCF